MIEKVYGFKDSKGGFHKTENEAAISDFAESIVSSIRGTMYRPSTYEIRETAKYLCKLYNLLDRPTVPFWKTII